MTESTIESPPHRPSVLDRTINLTAVTWATIAWVIVLAVALALRVAQLGHHVLSTDEARLADAAYRLFLGQTTGPGNAISDTGPAVLLAESLTFFLFGASDFTARLIPALLGIAMVALAYALRPIVG